VTCGRCFAAVVGQARAKGATRACGRAVHGLWRVEIEAGRDAAPCRGIARGAASGRQAAYGRRGVIASTLMAGRRAITNVGVRLGGPRWRSQGHRDNARGPARTDGERHREALAAHVGVSGIVAAGARPLAADRPPTSRRGLATHVRNDRRSSRPGSGPSVQRDTDRRPAGGRAGLRSMAIVAARRRTGSSLGCGHPRIGSAPPADRSGDRGAPGRPMLDMNVVIGATGRSGAPHDSGHRERGAEPNVARSESSYRSSRPPWARSRCFGGLRRGALVASDRRGEAVS
jgi:hypothetical protein